MATALKRPIATEFTLGILQDEGGGYSAIALNLPGAGSYGDTAAEAVENAREAILGVLESYGEIGQAIPWQDLAGIDTSEFVKLVRITVDV